ncbi:hypothetical protein BGZ73_000332 [Actinomortierella ambigua]|nr:hypothetical protein BGZ73_000332 [Actinomortierella ambigua]
MAMSTAMMVAPVFRKDKSATEQFSREYTTIYETDRGDYMPTDAEVADCQAQLFALLASPTVTDLHQSLPMSPNASQSPVAVIKNEPTEELADLFNLTIDDILDQSISSPNSMDASDFEEEQQRFQEFVFLQNYPFAEEAVDSVLVQGRKSTPFPASSSSTSSHPMPSETIASPVTPTLDWARSPSPASSLASPTMETLAKFEPYSTTGSPSSLRRASVSSTCSSSSICSAAGPVKSYSRSQSRRPTVSKPTAPTTSLSLGAGASMNMGTSPTFNTNNNASISVSQAHMKPRRRHRAVPATALVIEPGLKMVRNRDGSITVFNPETEETSYRCSLCPAERFGRIHDYKRHQLSKHQERVWPCEFCHRPFVRRDALLRHYAVKAGRDDNVHPTEDQGSLLAEARARAKLIG